MAASGKRRFHEITENVINKDTSDSETDIENDLESDIDWSLYDVPGHLTPFFPDGNTWDNYGNQIHIPPISIETEKQTTAIVHGYFVFIPEQTLNTAQQSQPSNSHVPQTNKKANSSCKGRVVISNTNNMSENAEVNTMTSLKHINHTFINRLHSMTRAEFETTWEANDNLPNYIKNLPLKDKTIPNITMAIAKNILYTALELVVKPEVLHNIVCDNDYLQKMIYSKRFGVTKIKEYFKKVQITSENIQQLYDIFISLTRNKKELFNEVMRILQNLLKKSKDAKPISDLIKLIETKSQQLVAQIPNSTPTSVVPNSMFNHHQQNLNSEANNLIQSRDSQNEVARANNFNI